MDIDFPLEINQWYRLHGMALKYEKHHTQYLFLGLIAYIDIFAVQIIYQ